ncbi:MAG TPA: DNA repair protein RecN [Actinomycetota bacterium]|nr:DNA repair protein RecN [Actinomycetota bacterium]
MLTELLVEGVGVIERAELSFDEGSCALTGETGAGKTLVVAAVALLLGERADRTLVRTGAPRALVEGRFSLARAHPVVDRLAAQELLDDSPQTEADVVLSRVISPEGRSRARVNGRLVPLAALAQIGSELVEIAGQSEHGRINGAREQRRLLDFFAGTVSVADEVAAAVRRSAALKGRLDEAHAGARARARELDVLEFEVAEIDAAGIEEGELDHLHAQTVRLELAEKVSSSLHGAVEYLRGEGGAVEKTSAAQSAVAGAKDRDQVFASVAERLGSCAVELEDIAQELRALTLEPDPEALEQAHLRKATVARLLRKYGQDEGEVLAYLERARARAEELRATDASLTQLEEEHKAALEEAQRRSSVLAAARRVAAPELAAAVEHELAALALEGARFGVVIEPCELGEGGTERVSFELAANPSEVPRPISKVASGGELARIALALHLVVRRSETQTMIFDEVDAGVGGQAALAVGRALAELGRNGGAQVLLVTHLPQVAAFADSHYRVVSSPEGAKVTRVEAEERVAELSRMLAGLPQSERAQEHAQELLALASAAAG